MTRKTAVLATVVLIIAGTSAALAGSSVAVATSDAPMAQENETETVGTEETETAVGGDQMGNATASVIFLNQTMGFTFEGDEVNTSRVVVERVVVPDGGFVVIHRAQNVSEGEYVTEENISVGAVIGHSTYLEPGVHENVAVNLNESVEEDGPTATWTLVAMAHQDTNDNQAYDFPEADGPYVQDGAPVIDNAYVIVEFDVIDRYVNVTTTETAIENETAMANETATEA